MERLPLHRRSGCRLLASAADGLIQWPTATRRVEIPADPEHTANTVSHQFGSALLQ